MSRRASSSLHPGWWVAALLLIGGTAGGGYALFRTVNDPFRTTAVLDTEIYLENANSLRGNVYRVNGTVRNFIKGTNTGRLFSVEVDDPAKSILPIVVPAALNQMNIQRGQQFAIRFEVDENGILRVQELRKI